MKLNLFTDYALRALMYLNNNPNRPVTADEIAKHFEVSREHMVKVIQELNRQGYVRSRRGRGGGSILARSADSITVADVIRTFEGAPTLLECLRSEGVCKIESNCRLKTVLSEAQSLMMGYLKTITIEYISQYEVEKPNEAFIDTSSL